MPKLIDQDDYRLVAGLIATARDEAGLTQAELGKRMGTTQKFVSVIETGVRRIDLLELLEFEKALGLSPLSLVKQIAAIASLKR